MKQHATRLNEGVRSFSSAGERETNFLNRIYRKRWAKRVSSAFVRESSGLAQEKATNTSSERLKSATYWWKKKRLIIQTYPQCVRVEVQTNVVVSAGLTRRLLPLTHAHWDEWGARRGVHELNSLFTRRTVDCSTQVSQHRSSVVITSVPVLYAIFTGSF